MKKLLLYKSDDSARAIEDRPVVESYSLDYAHQFKVAYKIAHIKDTLHNDGQKLINLTLHVTPIE